MIPTQERLFQASPAQCRDVLKQIGWYALELMRGPNGSHSVCVAELVDDFCSSWACLRVDLRRRVNLRHVVTLLATIRRIKPEALRECDNALRKLEVLVHD
jgi:hypothetical protein